MHTLNPLRESSIVEVKRQSRTKDTAIIEHFEPDAYGLLILAPEVALDSGWLGGDRVVGRAIRDLLIKAARFNEEERQRLSIYLPGRAVTLHLGDVEQHLRA